MKAIVHVSLKPGVLDVQGKAVGNALKSLGHESVAEVRQGKFFTFDLGPLDRAGAERQVDEMCRRLLANTVIEDYRFELVEAETKSAGTTAGKSAGQSAGQAAGKETAR